MKSSLVCKINGNSVSATVIIDSIKRSICLSIYLSKFTISCRADIKRFVDHPPPPSVPLPKGRLLATDVGLCYLYMNSLVLLFLF